MQIVLRQTVSKLFFRDDSSWARSPLEARCFDSPLSAYRYAKTRGLAGVEVVVLLPDGRLGGSLPVTEKWRLEKMVAN